MVHALGEVQRVLVPGGMLIDLRPLLDRWQIEVASARQSQFTGRMRDFPMGIADDEAANKAMREAEENGWFVRASEAFFPFIYSWDSASEMEQWIEEEWEGFIETDEESRRVTRAAWALGDGDSRVRLHVKMLITKWQKS